MNYPALQQAAQALRQAASRLDYAAYNREDQELFIAYCKIIVQHEKIRDIVAGRD